MTGQNATVTIDAVSGDHFKPATATVAVGQVVEWKNTDSIAHNIQFDGQDSISTDLLSAGQTWEIRFTAPGTYTYHCGFHSGMDGSITVVAASK